MYMTILHTAALQLAQKGLAVFPCQPRGKEPACDTGLHAATRDAERIDRWWRSIPELNIGIATGAASGIFVLDIDGEDGEGSLFKLESEHRMLPRTVEAITGKGRHCYFRLGEHGSVRNSARQIGAGLDVRGDGGYVIAPPSIHPSGRSYTWSVDAAGEFADAPDWLHTLIGANGNGKPGKPLEHWHATLTQPIHNGERNTTLASVAGKLLHAGLDVILTYDLLMCVNIARCEQPLSASEIEAIVISVGRTHLRKAQ
jgi:hypothetical protein